MQGFLEILVEWVVQSFDDARPIIAALALAQRAPSSDSDLFDSLVTRRAISADLEAAAAIQMREIKVRGQARLGIGLATAPSMRLRVPTYYLTLLHQIQQAGHLETSTRMKIAKQAFP